MAAYLNAGVASPASRHPSPTTLVYSPPSCHPSTMQRPTCTNLRVRTARDAEILFHAVALGMLPMNTRRLDSEERMALTTGCVYIWEERTSVSDSEHGIERWTEGRSWGPSRFVGALYYNNIVMILTISDRARDVCDPRSSDEYAY